MRTESRLLSCAALALAAALAAAAPARALSFQGAVDLAVEHQLAARLARARSEEARARALQSAAELLPSVYATAGQQRVFKENLAALGFTGGGAFPQMLGPFDVFDARFHLAMTLLDPAALQRWRAALRSSDAASLDAALAREQVAGAAGLAYVEALRAGEARDAAQADVSLAQALAQLAAKQHGAGTSTGVDVARAQTRLEQARLKLLEVEVARRQALVRLARVAGLPLTADLSLSDTLAVSTPVAQVQDSTGAVAQALSQRLELRIGEKLVEAQRLSLSAARAQRLPQLSAAGDWGSSGNLPDRAARATSSIGVAARLPLFSGGRLSADARRAAALRDEAQARLEDEREQVEEDVRLSLETMGAAWDQVATARQVVTLARRELALARDRFAAGVGDNIELVNAQDALETARDAEVAALAQFQVARINLALAQGRMGAFRL